MVLVAKRNNALEVYNPIYARVFNEAWIDSELGKLRPYAESYRAWLQSEKTDVSRLLRGQALLDAEAWASGKNLGGEDRDFLGASSAKEREEEIANKEKEAELERERKAREAAEKAERIQSTANRKAQRRIRIGSIVLGVTFLGAIISAGLGLWQYQKLQKTNKALSAVRELSELAGELRKKGQIEVSNEALRKAGLSTLIDNWNLKQAWLLAVTAEAEPSLSDEGQIQAQETIKTSLNSLNNIQAQLDPSILHQVRAFAYFQAGKLNDDQQAYYTKAYEALKASKFDPFPNKKTDLLTEEDVKNIHYRLIESRNIDINSSNEIAISFREHLYAGLEFLLQEDRLQEADQKTWLIMRYIARIEKERWLTVESLENFDCPALREIDQRWKDYPSKPQHFGFGQQKQIWQGVGSPDINSPIEEWRKFYIEIGWKTEESGIESNEGYVNYDNLGGFDDLKNSKRGNLPYVFSPYDPYGFWDSSVDGVVYIKEMQLTVFSRCEL